jgi:serine/threonine-protein kinase HipA
MIAVWADGARAGLLDRFGARGSSFAPDPLGAPTAAVSLTMPVQLASYDTAFGLAPIFEMNLPEGTLREQLRLRFAKATARFDDLDLLSLIGRSLLGRLRYAGIDEAPDAPMPFQSVDEILSARREGGLFAWLMERYAPQSGIAGVQPKVLVRDRAKLSPGKLSDATAIQSATHIVKLWEPRLYPHLAANEYFCLQVAARLGLNVPPHALSDDGSALVIERFDLAHDRFLGLEDFCVLNARGSARKYDGSIETSLFKRLSQFVEPEARMEQAQELWRRLVLNVALGNGDAHLKNFALLYTDVTGPAVLSPVFDLVTTTAYLPGDQMALTLQGSTRWPDKAALLAVGRDRAGLSDRAMNAWFTAVADALSQTLPDLRRWFDHSDAPEVGAAMMRQWQAWRG